MKTVILNIAGTSSGGSPYTPRVMQAVRDAERHGADIRIHVGEGRAKLQVMTKVTKEVLSLKEFISSRGGRSLPYIEVV